MHMLHRRNKKSDNSSHLESSCFAHNNARQRCFIVQKAFALHLHLRKLARNKGKYTSDSKTKSSDLGRIEFVEANDEQARKLLIIRNSELKKRLLFSDQLATYCVKHVGLFFNMNVLYILKITMTSLVAYE